MSKILVIAEHDGTKLNPSTSKCVTCASKIAGAAVDVLGPIMDTEIRNVGAPIVLGTIPGVVAIVGCSNYPDMNDVVEIAEEFARRKYIVVLSGCAAMAAGMKKDADGKTIYEKYPASFDAGGVLNVGSCVADAHITGAAIKIANIFATLPLRGNYEAIADYILNRVGAVGVAWGAYSQKAVSIATGCNRLGIPVLLGPHSAKYRRLFLSRKEEGDWTVRDGRTGNLVGGVRCGALVYGRAGSVHRFGRIFRGFFATNRMAIRLLPPA